MQEFAEVVREYDPRGGECVQWPNSEMGEAINFIKINASTTPHQLWDDGTLLYSPFVPSSRVNRRPSPHAIGKFAPRYPLVPLPGSDAEMYYVVKGPMFRVELAVILPNRHAVALYKEALRKERLGLLPFHVLTEDTSAQNVLEEERIVSQDPNAAPHLQIGARVLVEHLKKEAFFKYNGQIAVVLGDSENGRLKIDVDGGKQLSVKRENLTLVSAEMERGMKNSKEQNVGTDKPMGKEAEKNAARMAGSKAKPGTAASATQAGAGRQGNAAKGEKKKEGVDHHCASNVAELTPVVMQANDAKELEEVGVCLRSGATIFAGDDFATLSCSKQCGLLLLKVPHVCDFVDEMIPTRGLLQCIHICG